MRKIAVYLIAATTILASLCLAESGGAIRLVPRGTASLQNSASAAAETGFKIRQGPPQDVSFARGTSGTLQPARVPADHVPNPAASAITGAGASFSGFAGISHL